MCDRPNSILPVSSLLAVALWTEVVELTRQVVGEWAVLTAMLGPGVEARPDICENPANRVETESEQAAKSSSISFFTDGVVYMWNRWQDPETGRMLSEDPARDGSNWYAYAGNNPLTNLDRTGLIIGSVTDHQTMQSNDPNRTNSITSLSTPLQPETVHDKGCLLVAVARIINAINEASGIHTDVSADDLAGVPKNALSVQTSKFVDANGDMTTQQVHDAILNYTGKNYDVSSVSGDKKDLGSSLDDIQKSTKTDYVVAGVAALSDPIGGHHYVNATGTADETGNVPVVGTSTNDYANAGYPVDRQFNVDWQNDRATRENQITELIVVSPHEEQGGNTSPQPDTSNGSPTPDNEGEE